MRAKLALSMLIGTLSLGVAAQSAVAADASTLRKAPPAWLTDDLRADIRAAGAEGLDVPAAAEYLNTDCPGFQQKGISANGCIVAPYGCTANFIFSNGTDWRTNPYIGTASHCSDKNGEPVIMQVDTTTLAEVGTVQRQTAQEEPGSDFALIQIYPEVAAKWGVNPGIPTGGPQGIYTGCEPQVVKNYGHGYGVAVAQGKPEAGLATFFYDDGYGWQGPGLPGDSGSGITIQDNRSAGNFTHIIIFDPDLFFTPGTLTGTRTTAILRFLGAGWSQVNADGSLSRETTTACGGSVLGEATEGGGKGGGGKGGGGKGGGGKGGGKPPRI